MPKPSRFLPLLALLWLTFITANYYVVHKPFDLEVALSLGRALWQLGLGWAMLSVAGGLGVWLLPWLAVRPLARVGMQAALGLGVYGTLYYWLGALLGTSALVGWGLLMLLGLLLHRPVRLWWRAWGDLLPLWRAGGTLGRLLAGVTALVLWLTLITSLAPPFKFDALVYHLTLPKAYLQEGRITYLPWLMYWGMPQLAESLFTWAMSLGGEHVAALLGWAAGLLGLAVLLGYSSQRLGARAGWVAVAVLLSGFTLADSLAWGYVGWFTVLFGACAYVSLDLYSRGKGERYLGLAGVFAGLALGTKYTAGVLLLSGVGVTLWNAWGERSLSGRRSRLRPVWVFVGTAALVSLPWWVKNALATGNPFYPFFFPAGAVSALRLRLYQGIPVWGDWREAVFLPWRATVYGREGVEGFGASIGPLLLGLAALAGVGWRTRPAGQRITLRTAALLSGFGLLVWALLGRVAGLLHQTRLYLSLFPAVAVLAGGGYDALSRLRLGQVRLARVAATLILLVFSLNLFQLTFITFSRGVPHFLLGLESRQRYLEANLGMYALVMQAAHQLPAGARLLMLWEPRAYACLPRCSPDETLDRWLRTYRRTPQTQAILDEWRAAGYTHLLYYRLGADFSRQDPRFTPADWRALDELLASLPVQTDFRRVYTLYRLSQ